MIELKNLSCRDYSIELKTINPKPNLSFHQFKKFIYKYHPKYKFEFRALYAQYKNLLFDQDFLTRQEIQKLGEHYKLFKRSNYFPSRCMYLLLYHNNIFEYYKEVLEPVKSNKKYIKYLNN